MRRLASEFGVSTNTIYWHIGSREELINTIIEQVADRQAQLITIGETPFERVPCVARHLWRRAFENRNVTSLAHQTGLTAVLRFPLHVRADIRTLRPPVSTATKPAMQHEQS